MTVGKGDISKIVITGGPCAGKTTALKQVKNIFERFGYKILIVPETATELISSGITSADMGSVSDYQLYQISLQKYKEDIFLNAASKIKGYKKIIVLCDRGIIDSKAYMTEKAFKDVLDSLNMDEKDIFDSYQAVFHLQTAAKGAKEHYTLKNNQARSENVDEAIKTDDRLIEVWKGHKYFIQIDNSTDFDTKINRLISELASFLKIHDMFEIERKFLIEYPDISVLEALCNGKKSEIQQWYLNTDEGETRIRKRKETDKVTYFKTVKKDVQGAKRIEIEDIISEDEYFALLKNGAENGSSISKVRYCVDYMGHCFEFDIYPFWKDKAVMEIELNDQNENFDIPDFIKIIQEVTSDKRYNNFSLAKSSGII